MLKGLILPFFQRVFSPSSAIPVLFQHPFFFIRLITAVTFNTPQFKQTTKIVPVIVSEQSEIFTRFWTPSTEIKTL